MKLTPILLIPLLFLSSCTIDWNDEKDKKITELEKQIQDDTFKKKQECTKYIPTLENKIKEKEKNLNVDGDYYHETIDEVFYSSVKKTCIKLWASVWIIQNRDIQEWWTIKNEDKSILDILSNEEKIYDLKDNHSMALYFNEIKELKWE